jgi:hypothetical protein
LTLSPQHIHLYRPLLTSPITPLPANHHLLHPLSNYLHQYSLWPPAHWTRSSQRTTLCVAVSDA